MDIRDAQGGLPTTAIATLAQASYQAGNVPLTPGALEWAIAGHDPGAVIQGPATGVQVTVAALHRSVGVGDIQLVLTFSPADGSPPTVATLPLTVFAAEIRDADNAPTPALDVGMGSQVRYRPVVTPAVEISEGFWKVGANGRIGIISQSPTGEIAVTGQSVSPAGRDGSLTLVIRVGMQQATATVQVGVFDVRIEILVDDEDREIGRATGWVGVGEVVECVAEVVPADVIPPGGVAACDWSVSPRLQVMGDRNRPMASIVANAPSGVVDEDWVEVALTWQRSTVRARRALTSVGVSIRGSDGGAPHTSLGIGASAVYLAVVEPPLEEVQAFWATGRTATVEQQGLAARVTGVLPSEFEGADGLEVYVSAHGASTRALIPLTVFSMSIPAN